MSTLQPTEAKWFVLAEKQRDKKFLKYYKSFKSNDYQLNHTFCICKCLCFLLGTFNIFNVSIVLALHEKLFSSLSYSYLRYSKDRIVFRFLFTHCSRESEFSRVVHTTEKFHLRQFFFLHIYHIVCCSVGCSFVSMFKVFVSIFVDLISKLCETQFVPFVNFNIVLFASCYAWMMNDVTNRICLLQFEY